MKHLTSPFKQTIPWFVGLLGLAALLASSSPHKVSEPLARSPFADMVLLSDAVSQRISSWDQTGGNHDFKTINPGETLLLADIPDAGCIRHLYFSIGPTPHYLRDLVLRMYWDGETEPSVEVPFGDFFGQGHERERFFRSLMITVNEGSLGRGGTLGFNSYFPMPFANGARLELVNEGQDAIPAVWYHVEYEKVAQVNQNVGRFHAQWRYEISTDPIGDHPNMMLHDGVNADGVENYVILEAKGHGNLVGYFLNIDNHQPTWYGEGDDMIFIDGEQWPPSYHGTGSEEIFGAGACPNIEYAGPYTGFYFLANPDWAGKLSAYRFFVADPVRFRKSIRVTIEHGHANNMQNDYSSTAFWYQAGPSDPSPPLPPAAERHVEFGDTPFERAHQIHLKYRAAVFGTRDRLIQKYGIVPREIESEVLGPRQAAVKTAMDAQDYDRAILACQELIEWLGKIEKEYLAEGTEPIPKLKKGIGH